MLLVVERAATRAVFRSQIVVCVFIATIIPLGVAAYQIQSGAGLFDAGGFGRATGTFTHSNPMAAFMTLVVVMAFAHIVYSDDLRVRAWSGIAMAAASGGLIVTYTRSGWLAAILGVLVIAGTKGRRYVGYAAAAVLIVLITVPGVSSRFSDLSEESTSRGEPSNSLTWRAEYWAESLDLAHASPITGIGLKQVAAQSEEGKQPHNDFLRAYVEMGFVGLGAYSWMIWQFLNTARRGVRVTRHGTARDRAFAIGFAGCAAAYVLMCFVANLMSQVVVGLYFAAFAGAAAAIVSAHRGWRDPSTDEESDTDEDRGGGDAVRILHVNKFLHRKGGAEGYMLDLAELQRPARARRRLLRHGPPQQRPGQRRRGGVVRRVRPAARGCAGEGEARGPDDLVAPGRLGDGGRHRGVPPRRRARAQHLPPAVAVGGARRRAARPSRGADHARLQARLPDLQVPRPRQAVHGLHHQGAVGGRTPRVQRLARRRAPWPRSRSRCTGRFGAYDGVRRFISPSRFLAEQMTAAGIYPERIRVQSNFTDLSVAPRTGDPTRGAVFAGRLSDEKGVDTLIRAGGEGRPDPGPPARRRGAARDRRRRPGARRSGVAGREGSARAGPLPRAPGRPALQDLIRSAGLSVVPSRWHENQPLAVLESFALGVPVLGTDLGGLPEMVDDETGWVVPANDDEAMAAALVRALTDPWGTHQRGIYARKRVEERHGPTAHLASIESIYQEAGVAS